MPIEQTQGVGHFAIRGRDIERSKQFYGETLGFPLVREQKRKEDTVGCATTLNVCAQTVRALATLMAPFLPFSAEKCRTMLQLDDLHWSGATEEIPAGHQLGEPEILFRKLDAVRADPE